MYSQTLEHLDLITFRATKKVFVKTSPLLDLRLTPNVGCSGGRVCGAFSPPLTLLLILALCLANVEREQRFRLVRRKAVHVKK